MRLKILSILMCARPNALKVRTKVPLSRAKSPQSAQLSNWFSYEGGVTGDPPRVPF